MSVGPLGIAGALASTSLTQRGGSEIDKAQQKTADQSREAASEKNAAKATGVAEADKEEKAGDRDADGRRLWGEDQRGAGNKDTAEGETAGSQPMKSSDTEGVKGNQLDLDA